MSYRVEKGYGGLRVVNEDTGLPVEQGLTGEQAQELAERLNRTEEVVEPEVEEEELSESTMDLVGDENPQDDPAEVEAASDDPPVGYAEQPDYTSPEVVSEADTEDPASQE